MFEAAFVATRIWRVITHTFRSWRRPTAALHKPPLKESPSMTTNIDRRIAVLERQQADSLPLVVFGTPTPEQREAIANAERIGRPVIRWPVCVPRIESDLADWGQT